MIWVNFFHIYQPPSWPKGIIKKVTEESYRPILEILKNHPQIRITLNICGSLTEQLVKYNFKDVIENMVFLAKRDQVEFTGSAKYHTILPLLPKDEILRQISLNNEVNKKYLGKVYQPTGFFLPEMCYSQKLSQIIKTLGFKWIILDEIAYQGKLGKVKFDKRYYLKNGLFVIFRNRYISDYLAFSAPADKPDFFTKAVRREKYSKNILITAMDGENLGHHRLKTDKLWAKLILKKGVKTLTCSELIEQYKEKEMIDPKNCSWSSQEDEIKNNIPYYLWFNPKNKTHEKQWKLTYLIIKLVNKLKDKDPNYLQIRYLLDQALASDQYWWASANPWWSLEIIKNETRELANVIKGSKNISKIEEKETNKLVNEIIEGAESFEKSGEVKSIVSEYLKKTNVVRFMGGKKIK